MDAEQTFLKYYSQFGTQSVSQARDGLEHCKASGAANTGLYSN
jgi:hypothetical protein